MLEVSARVVACGLLQKLQNSGCGANWTLLHESTHASLAIVEGNGAPMEWKGLKSWCTLPIYFSCASGGQRLARGLDE